MKKLLFFVFVISMLSVLVLASSPFKDVKEGEWYYGDVNTAYEMGLINGKNSPETFLPNDNMTYAEAIKLAACMHQRHTEGKVTLQNGDPWYQPYVDYCKENKIIYKEYDYNAPATRGLYMEIFASALPQERFPVINNIPWNSIPDVPSNSKYAPAVYTLYRAGIVGGVDEKHSCAPETNIKRSEVATILVRMMDDEKRVSFSMVTDSYSSINLKEAIEDFFAKEPLTEEPDSSKESERDNTPFGDIKLPYKGKISDYIAIESSDYKGLGLATYDVEVTPEQLEQAVIEDLELFAKDAAVTDRGAVMGDYLNINFEGFIDGKAFDGGKATNYDMILGKANFIQGFEEQLVGHKAGEEFTIDVVFPEEYAEDLAGKKAQFKIKINTITEKILPELTEAFIITHFNYKTFEEYLAARYRELYEFDASVVEELGKSAAYNTVYGNVTFKSIPEDRLNYYYEQITAELQSMASMYGMTLDEFIEKTGMTEEEFEEYIKEDAKSCVEQELIAFAIADREGLLKGITVGEVDEYIESFAKSNKMSVENFKASYGTETILTNFVLEKAMQFVIDHSDSGEEKPISPKPSTPKDDDVVTTPEDDDDTSNPSDVEYETEYTPEALEAKVVLEEYLNATIALDAEKITKFYENPEESKDLAEFLLLTDYDAFVASMTESFGMAEAELLKDTIKPFYDAVINKHKETTYTVEGFEKLDVGYCFKVTVYLPDINIDEILSRVVTQENMNPILEELMLGGRITEETTKEEALTMVFERLFSMLADEVAASDNKPVAQTSSFTLKKVGDRWFIVE